MTQRLTRIESYLALAAAGLALLASLYLALLTIGQHQLCYGVQASRLLCQPIGLATATRAALVIGVMLVLYAGAALGAWFHGRAAEPSARSAALGLLCTCAVFVLCVTLPALQGPGFFYLPGLALLLVACALGLVAALRGTRASAAA